MSLLPAGPLAGLLTAPSGPQREEAWNEFIAADSGLLLFVARRPGGGDDAVMDRYAFVIEGPSNRPGPSEVDLLDHK